MLDIKWIINGLIILRKGIPYYDLPGRCFFRDIVCILAWKACSSTEFCGSRMFWFLWQDDSKWSTESMTNMFWNIVVWQVREWYRMRSTMSCPLKVGGKFCTVLWVSLLECTTLEIWAIPMISLLPRKPCWMSWIIFSASVWLSNPFDRHWDFFLCHLSNTKDYTASNLIACHV